MTKHRESTRKTPPRGTRGVAALSLLVAAHLGVVASVLLQDRPIIWPLHNDTVHRVGRAADFYAVYHAGVNLRHGVDPYANNLDGVTPYWHFFRYLPIVAIAAEPLTLLPPRAAYLLWVLVLEGLLAILLLMLWNRIADTGVRYAAAGILLVNSTYFLELYMGQFTFAAVTLVYLAIVLRAGQVSYSASALLKPFGLVVLPALATQRRYWSHGALALLCVVLFSLPYFLAHPEQWRAFVEGNFGVQGGWHTGNFGFLRFLQLVAEDTGIPFFERHWAACVGTLRTIVLGATALAVFHSKNRSVVVGAATLLLAHFLTYHHVWEHHMSGVCVAGAALLTVPDRPKFVAPAVLVSLLLLAIPTPFGLLDSAKDPKLWDPSEHWPRHALYLLVLPKVIPTMALFACSIAFLRRSGSMSPREALRAALARTSGGRSRGRR